MTRHRQWHVSGAVAWLLLPLAVPAGLLVTLAERLGWLRKGEDRTAQDVASYLAEFLDGTSGEWDWDDFTSIPISDPELEAIRQEADLVPLPLDDGGRTKIAALLERARALVRL